MQGLIFQEEMKRYFTQFNNLQLCVIARKEAVEETARGMGIRRMPSLTFALADNFTARFPGSLPTNVSNIARTAASYKGKTARKYLINCFGNNHRFI